MMDDAHADKVKNCVGPYASKIKRKSVQTKNTLSGRDLVNSSKEFLHKPNNSNILISVCTTSESSASTSDTADDEILILDATDPEIEETDEEKEENAAIDSYW